MKPEHGADFDSHWVLMWIYLFSKYSRQNSSIVPVLGRKVKKALYFSIRWYLGSQSTHCLNTTLFCTGEGISTQALRANTALKDFH